MKGTPLTDAIVDYMIDLFPAEDQLLKDLKAGAEARGIPPIQISPEQARFMQVLLRSIGARRVIEIGTLGGYSAIVMARALPEDGRLLTIERDPERAEFAREFIRRAGLESTVEVRTGAGADVLADASLHPEPYDFAFIDADKPGYVRYLELLVPLMRKGGTICGDNALAWGRIAESDVEDDVRGMQAFNRAMAAHPGIEAALVPSGDGMCIGVVL